MKNWKVRFENSVKRGKKTLYAFLVSTKQKFPVVLTLFLICHLCYFSLFIFDVVFHFLAYRDQTIQNIAKSKSWPIIKTLLFLAATWERGVVLYKNSNIRKEYAIQNRSNDTINLIKCFCFYSSCASNFAHHNFFQCISDGPRGSRWNGCPEKKTKWKQNIYTNQMNDFFLYETKTETISSLN